VACELYALTFGASDPARLADFWSGLLGWPEAATSGAGVDLLPADDTGFRLRFVPTTDPKVVANRIHLDLRSGTDADQQATVGRAVGLGARPIDVGQRPEEGHVVLADPDGNEFCVIQPPADHWDEAST
jgi:catechol 2,3-dioxygenase-like lactoylglutathione lyase family enzyme